MLRPNERLRRRGARGCGRQQTRRERERTFERELLLPTDDVEETDAAPGETCPLSVRSPPSGSATSDSSAAPLAFAFASPSDPGLLLPPSPLISDAGVPAALGLARDDGSVVVSALESGAGDSLSSPSSPSTRAGPWPLPSATSTASSPSQKPSSSSSPSSSDSEISGLLARHRRGLPLGTDLFAAACKSACACWWKWCNARCAPDGLVMLAWSLKSLVAGDCVLQSEESDATLSVSLAR